MSGAWGDDSPHAWGIGEQELLWLDAKVTELQFEVALTSPLRLRGRMFSLAVHPPGPTEFSLLGIDNCFGRRSCLTTCCAVLQLSLHCAVVHCAPRRWIG